MPRSRRFLALCAFVAALAWTNVQAMTCCWSWSAFATAISESLANPTSQISQFDRAESSSNAEAPASCHGPAPVPETADATESGIPAPATAPHHDARDASTGTPRPGCGDAFTSLPTAVSLCCGAPAPAESFSPVPHFDALPPAAFFAGASAIPRSSLLNGDRSARSPAPLPFLALERLLI